MCSAKILLLVFLFTFIFFTAAHFHLAGIPHFLTATLKLFFTNKSFLLCFQSFALALSLLSMLV